MFRELERRLDPLRAEAPLKDPETGVVSPHLMRLRERARADRFVLDNYAELGVQAASEEACRRYGHMRARGGLCERCGRGVSRRVEQTLQREVDLATLRAGGQVGGVS